ncbi:MAG TPA: valine--tRNA ligase [Candidatus Bathyarchaeia archaeon]|nr:MAG: valine--tRNA ligase [Candidatus Bathyarchaeota archaeon RBG_16_48_13]HJX22817.1 valine--tRNA ligase [Candidatus Bathyarchaeia archaeon]
MSLANRYNASETEKRWQQKWIETGTYAFDRSDMKRPIYTIDTPPPYPSGDFHMGNVLNWTYFDIVARYKRMKGYNVHFPQGWDCHGLPTEVQVEKKYGIKKSDIPPGKFRSLCEEQVDQFIKLMKEAIISLGCSVDWSTEYKTMDPDYWGRTQLSFILLYDKGLIYQGKHPVLWCPRCETAIADAEVEHETRHGKIYSIKFQLQDGEYLIIATTRPELLPSCVAVAVNPKDERYKGYGGREIRVPIFDRKVKIFEDEGVDPKFGTGVMMICTYGDKADVQFAAKYGLQPIISLDEQGRMTDAAGKYRGLAMAEFRKAIKEDVRDAGLLEKEQDLDHEVGLCWRCNSPVEILEKNQWFMAVRGLTEQVVKSTEEVHWTPNHMKWRLLNWATSLDWDWVISRQRIFATPIPVWYCSKCGESIIAKADWLPIDPKIEQPKINKCPKCGSRSFQAEQDVMDTWMDSSITCAVHAGWPIKEDWKRLFPASLHPSGTDIIRTWAYYLMVRHLALFNEKPYKACLINGMVLGQDGTKMSKSKKNYVTAPEVLQKFGSDAVRQWAAGGGSTGSDIPFRWADVEYGQKFLTKLWNASRFSILQLTDFQETGTPPALEVLDRWILSKLELATRNASDALEKFQFNNALEEIRHFTWHVFCDQYLEASKHRLYNPDLYRKESRTASQYTIFKTMNKVIRLLAPICPHITEEIHQFICTGKRKEPSVHRLSWPDYDEKQVDESSLKKGDLAIAVISEIRRLKAERNIPLNKLLEDVSVSSKNLEALETLKELENDIKGTCKIEYIKFDSHETLERAVEGFSEITVSIGSAKSATV